MRLHNYLTENISKDDLIKLLDKNCSQYKKLCEPDSVLYRGVIDSYITGFVERSPRSDRKPKDTPQEIHDYINNVFYKSFGWKPRSEGVFAISSVTDAGYYAHHVYSDILIFIPFDGFKFIWSPDIVDLYNYLATKQMVDDFNKIKYWDEESKEMLDKVLDKYRNDNLRGAMTSLHEIMFKCSKYYLIEHEWKELILDWQENK